MYKRVVVQESNKDTTQSDSNSKDPKETDSPKTSDSKIFEKNFISLDLLVFTNFNHTLRLLYDFVNLSAFFDVNETPETKRDSEIKNVYHKTCDPHVSPLSIVN